MTLQTINIPAEIKRLPHSPAAASLIDLANEKIEAFMLADDSGSDSLNQNFIPCDFHLLDQTLTWMEQNNLLTGRRFCELGSGFGVAALLTSLRGMESVGIEIEPALVEQAKDLADTLELPAKFYNGSFVTPDISETLEPSLKADHIQTNERDLYQEIGLGLGDFDLFFAFPWPSEQQFFEAVFRAVATKNSLLLTYRGSNGMHLIRKT